MNDMKNKIESICCFDVQRDPVVGGFRDFFTGYSPLVNYKWIIRTLIEKNCTLSEYLRDLIIYGNSEILLRAAEDPAPLRIKALEYDLKIFGEIAKITSKELKDAISEKLNEDLSDLPDYENGTFDYTAEYFLDFVRQHGNGIFARYRAFSFNGETLVPIEDPDPIRLSGLKNYEVQRQQAVDNTLRFISGKPARNVLLYGDRGTGKSATVKAIFNEFQELRMAEISKHDIAKLPVLFRLIKKVPLKFIITIDDLSFEEGDDRFGALKAALEGSLSRKPDNILIYATTNRRKIVRETAADREISGADAIDESMSLADRFGLMITFVKPDKRVYLDIVEKLAKDAGLTIPEDKLFAEAERFALTRSGRSPRTARLFVDSLKGHNSTEGSEQ